MYLKLQAQQKYDTKLLNKYLSADATLSTCMVERQHKITY